ncbi:hypothetical protein BDZ94DRAFT_819781 [Collybia nuda]|uniref:Uncharacterized protein n=1 Tax=Collybia nuda TaxID=64659 RepID=A0A9P5Y0W4_9AGAR|nr:hypothetical protein BDZ94DRAFT_819781 [Collybia nuda]
MAAVTTITRPADATFIVTGEPRWEAAVPGWTDLPGARIPLNLGAGQSSYGAVFVATFSSEALASGPSGGVVAASVFFGGTAAAPASANHRYVTTRGNPEWSSHTFIRTIRFDPSFDARDVTAQVKFLGSDGISAGIQNWVLKVERFNL